MTTAPMTGQHINRAYGGVEIKLQCRSSMLLGNTDIPGRTLGQTPADIKHFADFLSKSSKMLVYIEAGHRI